MALRPFKPGDEAAWAAGVSAGGFVTQDLRWRPVLADFFGLNTECWVQESGTGDIQGGVLFAAYRGRWSSAPFLPYAGPWGQIDLAALPGSGRRVRTAVPGDAAAGAPVTLLLHLPEEPAGVLPGLPERQRTRVRKAQKEGFVIERVGLDAFYPVYLQAMKAHGTPAYGRAYFEALNAAFGADIRYCAAIDGRRVVYAICEITSGAGRLYLMGGGDRRYFDRQPAVALFQTCLETAVAEGIRRYDFGRASTGEGTYQFKKQWGAKVYRIEDRFQEDGWVPHPAASVPRSGIKSLWRLIPPALQPALGAIIRRHVSI